MEFFLLTASILIFVFIFPWICSVLFMLVAIPISFVIVLLGVAWALLKDVCHAKDN